MDNTLILNLLKSSMFFLPHLTVKEAGDMFTMLSDWPQAISILVNVGAKT
jgi:hypothetical protein